ncbi:protein turtle homolog A [Alligator mississippiensis]|uniref:protein turtle homolog A n=1 Tax=Alligator mississippiensis TaxID=8496 RepID=UPI002878041C|nr:protein turtle homolog A [Alligator mississippiensis]
MIWCFWLVSLSRFSSIFAEGNGNSSTKGQAQSQAVVGRIGESVILGCDLLNAHEARPPLYVIEWVRFGFVLPIFIKFGLYSPRVDPEYVGRVRIQEGASLRIDLLRTEDQGWYECRVLFLDRHNNDDEFQNGTWIHLTVNSPPTFLETPPAFVEVRDRDPLSLTCRAVGNPQPIIIWKRSDLAVESGDKVQVRNGTLRITSAERTSAGAYTCHASSEEGTITHTTRVLVQGPPVIVVPPQNITVNLTQDAFLACQAEAYPGNLTYSWFQGNSNVYHLSHLQSRVRVLVDGSLLLQKTTPDDSGKYTCVPSNGLWRPPSASAFLTVLYPAHVTAMPLETHLPKGMQGAIQCPARANPPLLSVSWTKDGYPLQLSKFPGWSMRTDGSIVIAMGNDDALGVYTCTPYNSYGTAGESGPTRVLLKDPPTFSVRPKDEYFQEVGRELVIPCAAQGDPLPNITWAKLGSTEKSSAQVDGNSSLVFRPLVKEQHGVWRCTASNQVAQISTSTSVYVLGTSPHAVTNVSVRPLLLAVNVSWEPGFDGGYFQRFSVWYTLLMKRPNRAHHEWVSLAAPAGAEHLLVENLQPDTGYQFSILAQNKLGSGPFSEIVTSFPLGVPVTTVPPEPPTTTMRIVLSPPQSLMANETLRGVLLQWEPPFQLSVTLTGYALELRQDQGGWEVLDSSIPSTETHFLVPGLIKDAFYEFRLVAFAGSYISDPSNMVNVSTAGMEVYPSRTQLPELLPQPVLAGVIGGICFLSVAVIFSTMAACIMNRRRAARIQKRRQEPPIVFSPNKKLPPPQNSHSSGSSDSIVKLKPQASPYQSLRRTLQWGEKAGANLGITITAGTGTSAKYAIYESHIGEPEPLERICRGPDGRFVVETDRKPQERSHRALPYVPEMELYAALPQRDPSPAPSEGSQHEPYLQVYSPPRAEEPIWQRGVLLRPHATGQARREARASGYRQGCYFGYGSSSPTDEAKPLCIVNISPVASTVTLPYSTVEEPRDGTCSEGPCEGTASTLQDSPHALPEGSPVLSKLLSARPSGSQSSQLRASTSVQSGILQYLSLPFFKEMSVDGDWPPQEEPPVQDLEDSPHSPRSSPELTLQGHESSLPSADSTVCPDYMDTCVHPESPPGEMPGMGLLKPPEPQVGPAKAALPGGTMWPSYLSSSSDRLAAKDQASWAQGLVPLESNGAELVYTAISEPSCALSPPGQPLHGTLLEAEGLDQHRPPEPLGLPGAPTEKPLRGSLTSQSSGRGSVSFLRPPSLAPSLGGSYFSSPLGETGSWQTGAGSQGPTAEEGKPRKEPAIAQISKRRNTSVDENYEWDSEFALESEILDALQLYRSGDPKRPVSTIAVRELERQSARAPGDSSASSVSSSRSAEALEVPGAPSPEARCAALKEEFLAYRRRRQAARQRRTRRHDERFELATLL